jgi:hypothetical protein
MQLPFPWPGGPPNGSIAMPMLKPTPSPTSRSATDQDSAMPDLPLHLTQLFY